MLRQDDIHIARNIVFRKGNRHVLSADYVGGAQENGIAELLRRRDSLLFRHDSESLGTGDIEFFEKLVKALPVLRHVDGICARAQNTDSLLIEIAA